MAAGGKAEARRLAKAALKALDDAALAEESAGVARHVLASDTFRGAKRVGLYVAAKRLREVDTAPLLDAVLSDPERTLYVPLVDDSASNMRLLRIDSLDELTPKAMSILEPDELRADGTPRESALDADPPLDVLIMPGLAFDRAGRRLGRGGGYYDVFLERCHERARANGWPPLRTVALAYRAQLVERVPTSENDAPVDAIVTADGFVHLVAPEDL